MMKNAILYFLLLFSGIAGAQIINIPDSNLKAKLLSASMMNGTAKDAAGNNIAIDINAPFGEIDVTEAHQVFALNVAGIAMTNPEGLQFFENLTTLDCSNNMIMALDLSALIQLESLTCNLNMLTTLDLSANHNLIYLNSNNNNLVSLFVKNGSDEVFAPGTFTSNAMLEYVCADEFQIPSITVPPTVVLNGYCSFTPGGMFNKISGNVRFDLDGDGCDDADVPAGQLRLSIDGDSFEDAVFADNSGAYTSYAGMGMHFISPLTEEAGYYTITPPMGMANFPVIDGSGIVQDYCIMPNGAHPDVEVVMAPLNEAVPGNNALYKIIYKNKGNQTLNGIINCNWQGDNFEFFSMSPMANTILPNSYTWNYTNLRPFESRVILLTLTVHTPAAPDGPVNVGDVLPFTMTATPADETPGDNLFQFNQVAKAVSTPNSITCIQGEHMDPEDIGNYLHYIINFSNTGTQQANNIVVAMDVDPGHFDINSLQVLNASHHTRTRITGNTVEFIFEGANLAVADHGNILVKQKTKGSVTQGQSVGAQARIYMDYKAPAETNTATTTFEILSAGDFKKDPSVVIYPNPVKDVINITAQSMLASVELYDVQGRLLQASVVNTSPAQIDMAGRAAGVYFLKVTTDKGVNVEQVIKE